MRPYWAVIVDSFRESLSSRVLWVLVGLITLLLLLLAPLTVKFSTSTGFYHDDVDEVTKFAQTLQRTKSAAEDSPQRAVWNRLSDDLKKEIDTFTGKKDPSPRDRYGLRRHIVREFNDLVKDTTLLTEEQRQTLTFDIEGRDLMEIADGSRSKTQSQRLNRLALSACFPRFLPKGVSEAMTITYLGMNASDPLPADRDTLHDTIKMGLAFFMDAFAAPLGIFVSILVTASIIPNMFDSGSVNLLFSKPINRGWLYLSKFVGGCWFVLINASFLVIGLWLLLGIRFGLWHRGLLWVIPVLTFLFAVYYSVSAFAGIIWRNTIMAIAVAVLFWGLCTGVGFFYGLIEELVVQPKRIVNVVPVDDGLLSIDESGQISSWDDKTSLWMPVFSAPSSPGPPAFARRDRYLGPIYDAQKKRIVTVHRTFVSSKLVEGSAEENWKWTKIDTAPMDAIGLFAEPAVKKETEPDDSSDEGDEGDENANDATEPEMGFVLVDPKGISRVVSSKGPGTKNIGIFGMNFELGAKRGSYENAGPKNYEHAATAVAAAMNTDNKSLLIYGQGKLHRLTPRAKDRRYEVITERDVFDAGSNAAMATGGKLAFLVSEDHGMELLDATSLETVKSFETPEDAPPRFAVASPDGKFFAAMFHNGKVWCYDTQQNKVTSDGFPKQSDITGLAFHPNGKLLVASDPPRIAAVDPATGSISETWKGRYSLLERIHFLGIRPLYRVFPKPAKLKETASYLMVEKSTLPRGPDKSMGGSRVELDPWKPVWQSAIFMGVMLLLACVYISRQEI